MPTIAPWLIPADPLRAAQGGTSAALEYRGQDIQANEHAAALAQAAQEAQMAHQLDQEKLAGGLAEMKARTDIESQSAARKFQAQRGYQLALDSGEEPEKAFLRFGPQMTDSTNGIGQIIMENYRNKQAAAIPQAVMDPNDPKLVRGYTMNGVFHTVAAPRPPVPRLSPGLKARLDAAVKNVSGAILPEEKAAAIKALEGIASEADQAMAGDGEVGVPSQVPSPAGSVFDYEYDPKAQTFKQVGK